MSAEIIIIQNTETQVIEVVNPGIASLVGSVRYDVAQTLSSPQKAQVWANIGGAAAVLATTLAGFSSSAGGTVTSADSILVMAGKFEHRLADLEDGGISGPYTITANSASSALTVTQNGAGPVIVASANNADNAGYFSNTGAGNALAAIGKFYASGLATLGAGLDVTGVVTGGSDVRIPYGYVHGFGAGYDAYMTAPDATTLTLRGGSGFINLTSAGASVTGEISASTNVSASVMVQGPFFNSGAAGANKSVFLMNSNGAKYGVIQVENTGGQGAWSLGHSATASNVVGTPVLTWGGDGSVTVAGIQTITANSASAAMTVTQNGAGLGISLNTGKVIGIGTDHAYMYGSVAAAEVGTSTNSYKIVVGGGQRAEFKNTTVNLTLPTSSAGLSAGDLWNDSGTVKVA